MASQCSAPSAQPQGLKHAGNDMLWQRQESGIKVSRVVVLSEEFGALRKIKAEEECSGLRIGDVNVVEIGVLQC